MAQKQEQGDWKPHDVVRLEHNIALVMKTRNIRKLNHPTYSFIIMQMGFIAHYDLGVFQHCFVDIPYFASMLQSGEGSGDLEHNLKWADHYEKDRDFNKWYGPAYCKSVADGIRRIVAVARSEAEQHAQAALPLDLK